MGNRGNMVRLQHEYTCHLKLRTVGNEGKKGNIGKIKFFLLKKNNDRK
jgi:hypothetical protein